jgi:hypothetical protein
VSSADESFGAEDFHSFDPLVRRKVRHSGGLHAHLVAAGGELLGDVLATRPPPPPIGGYS